jgi:hypothetical protein
MKNLQVVHNTEGIIYRGDKESCKHFIKCRKYSRDEISIVPVTTTEDIETITTIPVVEYKKPTLFQRMFKR